MKGLLLSSYYTSKKSLFTYLIVALASAIMFSFSINHDMLFSYDFPYFTGH